MVDYMDGNAGSGAQGDRDEALVDTWVFATRRAKEVGRESSPWANPDWRTTQRQFSKRPLALWI